MFYDGIISVRISSSQFQHTILLKLRSDPVENGYFLYMYRLKEICQKLGMSKIMSIRMSTRDDTQRLSSGVLVIVVASS